jgi:hypothetical protein
MNKAAYPILKLTCCRLIAGQLHGSEGGFQLNFHVLHDHLDFVAVVMTFSIFLLALTLSTCGERSASFLFELSDMNSEGEVSSPDDCTQQTHHSLQSRIHSSQFTAEQHSFHHNSEHHSFINIQSSIHSSQFTEQHSLSAVYSTI